MLQNCLLDCYLWNNKNGNILTQTITAELFTEIIYEVCPESIQSFNIKQKKKKEKVACLGQWNLSPFWTLHHNIPSTFQRSLQSPLSGSSSAVPLHSFNLFHGLKSPPFQLQFYLLGKLEVTRSQIWTGG